MSQTDIRAAIVAAMTRQGMTRNQLAVVVEGKVSRSMVYDYIKGKRDVSSESASHLLRVLGLKVK